MKTIRITAQGLGTLMMLSLTLTACSDDSSDIGTDKAPHWEVTMPTSNAPEWNLPTEEEDDPTSSMAVTAALIDAEGHYASASGGTLAALAQGECVGKALATKNTADPHDLFYLYVHKPRNYPAESSITLAYYDPATRRTLYWPNATDYAKDAIRGTFDTPFRLDLTTAFPYPYVSFVLATLPEEVRSVRGKDDECAVFADGLCCGLLVTPDPNRGIDLGDEVSFPTPDTKFQVRYYCAALHRILESPLISRNADDYYIDAVLK
ncbi:MAG: hypothetical protein KBS75_01875 [Bacteroidales bacterium]|nr:hypothetical protein [Candidatus Equimonas faecalis]